MNTIKFLWRTLFLPLWCFGLGVIYIVGLLTHGHDWAIDHVGKLGE